MSAPLRLTHWFDYKSPYAFLAQEETFALAAELDVELELVPYTLDIPAYLGSAELDDAGRVVDEDRNPHQWRRVHYAYMDCRREARRRGLVLRGPRRIFDSSVAHIGFLWARQQGDPRGYHGAVFERFFRREFDPGDAEAVAGQLATAGFSTQGFEEFLVGAGRAEHDRLRFEAEAIGVFGVPSYRVDGELYWGAERLERVRARLLGASEG